MSIHHTSESVKQPPQERSKERKTVPNPPQLARANFLALYWDKPLSSLIVNGEALPGIQGRFLPDDPEELQQSLGHFLSHGDPTLPDYESFHKATKSTNRQHVARVIRQFKNLCPSPQELLERNPHLVNWVPWETFIAYGDVLQGQKTEQGKAHVRESVTRVVKGEHYLSKVQEKFPRGYPRKRTDVVLERQNKDPKTQGVLEAVSNSVDAISEREKIGQFGLGVKQTFAWLERGKGEVSAVTRTKDGKTLALRARKGYDDQIYIKFSPPTPQEREQFEGNQTGTMLTISGIDIDKNKQHELARRVEERFRYVPETQIAVNGHKINGYDAIKVIGRAKPVDPHGHINVTLQENKIAIKDSGSGMDEETLFRMFLPGHGKGYNPLSATEAKHIAHEQAEVLLIDEERPRIVFSRNREADFAIEVPHDRTNTSSKTIVMELGRILKVSEGREGFEIDENFATAVSILTEKTLTDTALSNDEKTTFLNSIVLGIDQLAGITDKDQAQAEDKTASIVRKTKSGIRKVATPYLQELKKSETTLLPNYDSYQKLATDAQYVDPYLLEGVADIPALLEDEGFQRLKSQDGITTKNNWRVLTAKFTHKDLPLLSGEGRGEVRGELDLPIILDPSHRVAILDQSLWQAMDQEQDPIKKAYLQETIQTMLNEKVYTSYEAEDPRAIYVTDKKEAAKDTAPSKHSLSELERKILDKYRYPYPWTNKGSLFASNESGILKKYDINTQVLQETYAIPEMEDKNPLIMRTTEKGTWVLCQPGELFFLDQTGTVQERFKTPTISILGYGDDMKKDSTSITEDGHFIYMGKDAIHTFNPFSQEALIYNVPIETTKYNNAKPYLTIDKTILFEQSGQIFQFDPRDESLISSAENALQGKNASTSFIDYKGKTYVAGTTSSRESISGKSQVTLFALNKDDNTIQTNNILEFTLPKNNLSNFSMSVDTASNRIIIQVGTLTYFLKQTETGFAIENSYEFDYSGKNESTAQGLHALKDLFGDDPDTSYADAVLALHSRLEADAFSPIDIQGQKEAQPKRPRWDDDEVKREVIRTHIDQTIEWLQQETEGDGTLPSIEEYINELQQKLENAHTSEDLDKLFDDSLARKYKIRLIENVMENRKNYDLDPDWPSFPEKELDKILDDFFPPNQEPAQEDSNPKRPRWDNDKVKRIAIQEHIGWEQMYLEQEKEEGEDTRYLENYYKELQQKLDNTHTSEGLNTILDKENLVKHYKITLIDNELILRRNTDSPYPDEQSLRDRLGLVKSEEELDSILNELFPDDQEPAEQSQKYPYRALAENEMSEEQKRQRAELLKFGIDITKPEEIETRLRGSEKARNATMLTFGIVPIQPTEPKKENKTEELVALLESPQLRDVFHPLWDGLKEQTNVDELEGLKMRFVKNAPLLVDVDGEITKETLQLFFYADNPQVFFPHNEEQQQQFTKMLEGIDSLSQKETLVRAAELLTHGKTAEERELFYEQLGKVFSKERFRETFLRAITQNKTDLAKAASAPETLEITDPLRSYFLFLTNQAELIRTKEILPTQDSYEDVLPANIPLELLAHLRLTEGLYTIEEMRDKIEQEGGTEAISQKINLFHYQDEIRKAIHAQATEAGIEKRELLQNAFDAIRKKGGEGRVGVDFYLRNGGDEFVEEVRDNGTGIDKLVAFLVPGVTTKEGTGEQGFFGTGFYKNLEDVDTIEVDSVVKRENATEAQRIIIDVLRDDEGSVQGGTVREIRSKQGSILTDTGTTIRLVRNTQDRLPELEAMIAKNTYVTMGGLATIPQLSESNLSLAFTDEEGHENPVHVPVKDRSSYTVDGIGEIIFVQSPNIPPLMTSAGLRMSLLYGSEYMHDVPEPLKNLFADGRISVVLPKNLSLVKDRSRLANEEHYLSTIQQTIATESIKRAAFDLLSDTAINVRGVIPEDILSNNDYYRILTSPEGRKAYTIAQKISSGEVLDAHDLDYINAKNDVHPLVLVLLGIEKTGEDGKKDSLLRRYQYIQEKSGNTAASTIVSRTMDIDPDETTYSPQLAREEKRFVEQTQMGMETAQQIGALEMEFNQGRRPESVKTLAETNLTQEEKDILNNYFSGIGFEDVYFSDQLNAGGVFTPARMYLNANLLHLPPRQRLETIIHESSHLFEMRAAGLTEGAMDTEAERRDHFTHQQEGSFAHYYKTAANIMQAQLIE